MKSLLITTGLLGLFNFSNAGSTNTEATFQEEFANEISYPQTNTNSTNEVVYVSFFVNADGSIEVEEMNASSEEFAKYVEEKIEAMNLNHNDLRTGQSYNYKMSFKKQ